MSKLNQEFLSLFKGNHFFAAYDYRRELPSLPAKNKKLELSQLKKLNKEGYCIYFAVNEVEGNRRTKKNITRVRAIWIDDDKPRRKPRTKFPIPPSIVVQTSRVKNLKKFQYYWLTSTTEFNEFEQVMQCMIDKYGNDKGVRDLPRVLRIPGFKHNKNLDKPCLVRLIERNGKVYDWETIKVAFPPITKHTDTTNELGEFDLESAIEAITSGKNYHNAMCSVALSMANQGATKRIFKQMMHLSYKASDNKRPVFEERLSEEHLDECYDSAVEKIEGEESNLEKLIKEYESEIINPPKVLSEEIIAPSGTLLGDLVRKLYQCHHKPNLLATRRAVDSTIAFLAGGKYRSNLGDRVNMFLLTVGRTASGKDTVLKLPRKITEKVFTEKNRLEFLLGKIPVRAGSYQGVDDNLRVGDKHDALYLKDEVSGYFENTRDPKIVDFVEYFLSQYSASDGIEPYRVKAGAKVPDGISRLAYAPQFIFSGATTTERLLKNLNTELVDHGLFSRFRICCIDEHEERLIGRPEEVEINSAVKKNLRKIAEEEDAFEMLNGKKRRIRYPRMRVKKPIVVKFDERAEKLAEEINIHNDEKRKGLSRSIWIRQVMNAKKSAMLEAILEDPISPCVGFDMLIRHLSYVAHECQYVHSLMVNEAAENKHELLRKKIINYLLGKFKKGEKLVMRRSLSNQAFMKAQGGLTPTERKIVLDEMKNNGEIDFVSTGKTFAIKLLNPE